MKFILVSCMLIFSFTASAQSLTDLVNATTDLINKNEFAKALPAAEKAARAIRETFGESNVYYGTLLTVVASCYQHVFQYGKAESTFIEAGEILRKTAGEKSQGYATWLNGLASLYTDMVQYEKAEPLFIQAKEIRKNVLGENHPEYAASLNDLAFLYESMALYERSELLYSQAKEIFKNTMGENSPAYATSLNNLALLYLSMGEYERAEPLFIQAKEIRKNVLGEKDPGYAESLNNLAGLYQNMDRYEKAEPLFIQAKEIRKNALGEDHPDYLVTLNNLGLLYQDLGQYEKAEALYIQVKETKKKITGENHPDYALSLNNLATLYQATGQYEKAEPLCIQSNEIMRKSLGKSHPKYGSTLNNLAALYTKMGQYEKAEPLYIQAKEIRKNVLGENHPGYAASLNNLAGLYQNMGQYEKAEPLYIQAKNILKNALGETHPDYATSLENLALLYLSMGQYEKAEPLLLQSDHIILQNLLNNFTILSEKEKGDYITNKTSLLETNNSFIYNYKKASSSLLQNNFNQQLIFKSLVLTDTRNILTSIQRNADTAMQQLMKDWQNNKSILAKQYSLPISKRRTDIKEIETKAENLEKDLARQSAPFRNQQNAIRISLQDVQKNLQEDEAAIEFVRFRLYNKKWTDSIIYAAYILHKDDLVPVFVILCEEKQLQRIFDSAGKTANGMVNSIYRGLKIKNRNAASLGDELYQLIWQPLEPYLKGTKKISYSPAGKLYSIAFHALPVDDSTILMDKYQLQQYTSTRQVTLRDSANQTPGPGNIVLFGNASFTMDSLQLTKQRTGQLNEEKISRSIYTPPMRSSKNGIWADLPGTAEEVRAIKQLFDQNKITARSFVQTAASEESLKALNDISPQVLHIATHGFFLTGPDKKKIEKSFDQGNTYTLASDPLLRSGLILAGGNYAWSGKTPIEGVEDGIVTAYEISQLDLSNTELVVLSACETALGDVRGSEGVFGLQRALKMSGVKKMIVSLWKVPDKETAELMTTFYTWWMNGKTINNAFAQAQADMRKKYSPFYWAAFVLVE